MLFQTVELFVPLTSSRSSMLDPLIPRTICSWLVVLHYTLHHVCAFSGDSENTKYIVDGTLQQPAVVVQCMSTHLLARTGGGSIS